MVKVQAFRFEVQGLGVGWGSSALDGLKGS